MKFDLQPIKDLKDDLIKAADKNSPTILTGIAIAGFIGTVIFAVKATPKAQEIIKNAKEDLATDGISEEQEKEIKLEATKEVAKVVAPAVITGATTVACMICSNTVSTRRIAALSAAYNLSTQAASNYQEKVKELLGEKKEEKIREAVAAKHISEHPVNEANIIDTGAGDILCCDYSSGRYFLSKPDAINQAVNEFNKMLLEEDYLELNSLYSRIGLPDCMMGDEFGWHVEDGLVEVAYSSTLTPDNRPALMVDFMPRPNWRFDKSNFHR